MISEGSCDTEDWSRDAENSALYHMNKLHFEMHSTRKKLHLIVILFDNIILFWIHWLGIFSVQKKPV